MPRGIFPISFCNQLKAALQCRNCALHLLLCRQTMFSPTGSLRIACAKCHIPKTNCDDIAYIFMANRTFHLSNANAAENVLFCRPEKCTFPYLQMTHFHISSAIHRMCRLKSVPAHHRIEYPALLCVLQPPLGACRHEGAFCSHAAAASAHL